MRTIIAFLTVSLLLIIAGCGKEPGITGYVIKKNGQEILIVSAPSKDYSENGGASESYDAVWVANSPDEVRVGQKVKVWFKGDVADSYPAQATLSKLEVLPSTTQKGATLSKDQALNIALSQSNFGSDILAVKSISYDRHTDRWTITLNHHSVEVDDKTIDKMPKAKSGVYYGSWMNNPFTWIVGSIIIIILMALIIFKIKKRVRNNKSY